MKSVYGFVIKPIGGRYNNTKNIGGKELIVNTEMYNHQFVNRKATVISRPIVGNNLGLNPGDTVIVHHNVFRRWHDVKGRERNSKSYFNEDTYIVNSDQIFLHKPLVGSWSAPKGFSFIKPIKSIEKYNMDCERELMGIIKYSDGSHDIGDVVGVRPNSKYEFIIDGQRLYRVMNSFITIKYEYKGNEEEYNPSWANSS
tara:strand:+ start:1082 stop:1678 length:597 start_codon:yes stop_codon:yes gene_type:complete